MNSELMHTRILGVGTAVPQTSYTQKELLQLFGFKDRVTKAVFAAPHIERRYLTLPEVDPATGLLKNESQAQLNEKYRKSSLEIGGAAIVAALKDAGVNKDEIGAVVAVTSTGWLVPGLTCLFMRELGLPPDAYRADIVGMGCNAGLNGLATIDGWARLHPKKVGVMVCCEVNSAIYCRDDSPRDGIVNALFGDGAAALVVGADDSKKNAPEVIGFTRHMIGEEWGAMRFDWHDELHRWRFYLSKEIPYLLGVHVDKPVRALLDTHKVHLGDVDHWIIHTGGGSVVDAIRFKLGLSEHAVRHTRSVLRDYGNVSSGSFLFSYDRLLREGVVQPGDYGVMITMGPGAQIETALLRW